MSGWSAVGKAQQTFDDTRWEKKEEFFTLRYFMKAL